MRKATFGYEKQKKITKFIDFWRRLVTSFALYKSFILCTYTKSS